MTETNETRAMLKRTHFTAAELMRQDFPPAVEVVTGIIQAGENLLVSPPKTGKSWMVLDLALAAASGGRFLDCIPVEQRPVLYMALEDGPRRLQNRMRTMGWSDDAPAALTFLTRTEEGHTPSDTIRDYLTVNEKRRPMVIVDTLAMIKAQYPKKGSGESDYEREYRIMSELKRLVDACDGASLIIVHHTRKDSSGDFVDSVSGTNGLAGAADAIIALTRERGQSHGSLHATSRDASEGEYSVDFDSEHGRWRLQGGSLPEAARRMNAGRLTDGLGDSMTDIIECVNRHAEGVSPQRVSEETGIPADRTRRYLRRALDAHRVTSPMRGSYAPLSEAASVTSVTLPLDVNQENGSEKVTPRIYSVPTVTTSSDSDTSDTCDTPTHTVFDASSFLAGLPPYVSQVDWGSVPADGLQAIVESKVGLWPVRAREEMEQRNVPVNA